MHESYSEHDKIGFNEAFWKRYKQISQQEEQRLLAKASPNFIKNSEVFNKPTDLKTIITSQSNPQIVNYYIEGNKTMSEFNFNEGSVVNVDALGDNNTLHKTVTGDNAVIYQGQTGALQTTDDLQTLIKRLEKLIEQTEELQDETKITALNHLDALSKSGPNLSLNTVNSAKDFFQDFLEAGVTGEIINQIKFQLIPYLAELSSRVSS